MDPWIHAGSASSNFAESGSWLALYRRDTLVIINIIFITISTLLIILNLINIILILINITNFIIIIIANYQVKQLENVLLGYLSALAFYKFFYILNWVHRYYNEVMRSFA